MSENENNDTLENPVVEEAPKELSPEELKAELKRVRNEAASRRIELKELKSKADKWEEYQASQKTELEKLQESLAAKEKALADYEFEKTKRAVAKEFELDDEDIDLLTGADEDSIRKQAERLKARLGKATPASRPADLLAGNRGNPLGSKSAGSNTNSFDDIIRKMAGK